MGSRFGASKKRLQTCVLIAASALVIAVLPAVSTRADDGPAQYITLTPASQDLKVDPGGKVSGKVSVLNQGTEAFKLSMNASPYRVEGVQYDPKYTRLPGTSDPSQWVTIADRPVERQLDRGKILDAEYTISVPEATQPGGYYVVIFAETSPAEPSEGSIAASSRVGQVVYITVNGDVKREGSVTARPLPSIVLGDSVEASLFIKNTGGVHFASETKLSVRNLFGGVVYQTSQQRYILPQTKRQVDFSWSAKNMIGIYKVDRGATLPSGKESSFSSYIVVLHPLVIGLVLVGAALFAIVVRRRQPRSGRSG